MIFFDSHIHFYPFYDLDMLFSSFVERADAAGGERKDLAMAVLLRSFQTSLESAAQGCRMERWSVDFGHQGFAVATDGLSRIFLLPGRQVAARERVEALGYFGDAAIPDGMSLGDTLQALRDASLEPLVAWGLGKWLFGRGRIVDAAINEALRTGASIGAGDSAMRPVFWPYPSQYRRLVSADKPVLCGSDPLPKRGEEKNAGRYAMMVDASLDEKRPAESLRKAIWDSAMPMQCVGSRRRGLGFW